MTTAVDVETHLIKPGCITPRLVCVTTYNGTGEPQLYDREIGLDVVENFLRTGEDITGHHFFFDLGVIVAARPWLLPLIFQGIDAGKIHCTKIREQMIANAKGELKFAEDELGELRSVRFLLADLAFRRLGIKMLGKGADAWRMRYNELDGVPLSEWPEEARIYAMDDAGITQVIHEHQAEEARVIPGEIGQMQAGWSLYLLSMWGVRTDPEAVAVFEHEVLTEFARLEEVCLKAGYVREAKSGKRSRNMAKIKEAIVAYCTANGLKVPITPKKHGKGGGNIRTNRDTLALVGGKGSPLEAVAELGRVGKLKGTYLPILKSGTVVPVNAAYQVMVETFRTSCRSPNLQNPMREGGFRACFVPRPNHVYVFSDYSTLEMRSLAQVCLDAFGFSSLADALNVGKDPHTIFAAYLLGIEYEAALARLEAGDDETTQTRAASKIANFGFPGGMGSEAFVDFAWSSYHVRVSLAKAQELHGAFRRLWPEMEKYFAYCSRLVGFSGEAEHIVSPQSGLVRGKVRYTATANHFFQHLAAMGAKDALYNVTKECYLDRSSPLFGCRPVFFLHDEIGMEAPYDAPERASAAADRLSAVMIEVMKKWIPDVPVLAEPVMLRRWHKGAKPVRVDGVLMPCKPAHSDGKTKWVRDA